MAPSYVKINLHIGVVTQSDALCNGFPKGLYFVNTSVTSCQNFLSLSSSLLLSWHFLYFPCVLHLSLLQNELTDLRNSISSLLDNPEVTTIISRLNFAQCTYLLSVFKLETLRWARLAWYHCLDIGIFLACSLKSFPRYWYIFRFQVTAGTKMTFQQIRSSRPYPSSSW